MTVEVILPELGESVTEATITCWLVEVGDQVDRDQPIVEISTDKVDAGPGEAGADAGSGAGP